jgi:hypothetical protein
VSALSRCEAHLTCEANQSANSESSCMGMQLKLGGKPHLMLNQIVALGIIVLSFMSISNAQTQGPILAEKLEMPEKIVKQTLQKRALIWIDGQWKIEDNQYIWVSGHWETKKIGYIFINGEWKKTSKGWIWTEGFWKKIDINKWMTLYA